MSHHKKPTLSKAAIRLVLTKYFGQYRKYPVYSVLACICPAVGSILIFFIPPVLIARIVDTFTQNGSTAINDLIIPISIFAGSWMLGEILWRIGMHCIITIESKGMKNLNKEGFEQLTKRDYNFFTNHFVGSITKQTLAYSRGFERFTDTLCFNIFNNLIPAIFAFVVLWRYSPYIPMLLLICLVSVVCIAIPIVRKRMKYVIERHDAHSKMAGRLSDSVTNILNLKSFAKEDFEAETYREYVDNAMDTFKKAADYQNLRFDTVISPIYVLTNVIGLLAAVFFVNKLGLAAGVIVVVYSYYSSVTRTFWDINRVYRDLESCVTEAAEFTHLIIEPPMVSDIDNAKHLHVTGGNIKFEDVGFRYGKNSDDPLFLENFQLDIPSNQKVGLVGPSGGGKTTITKLLLRFLNIHGGSITIDGQDISHVTQASLRENIAYVPQEPLLFHRSLYENIAYSDEDVTEEAVMEAAKLARADEFIHRLPHGYNTMVGERGVKLSGGQRQRIAIARALLKHSKILILDEATSALDSESEKYIQEGLVELMKDKTALVIAHRLSTIKHLDRIIVLDEGKIVQDGTHDQLIKVKGLYANLWSHQSGEFLED